jgi:hypothetical protein
MDGGPRSATVTAATDLVCYGLTFWEFRACRKRVIFKPRGQLPVHP